MAEHGSSRAQLNNIPLLIGLGPIRSGTTWVHELLFGHSQVATTRMKEVNFFNHHFDAGSAWYDEQFRPATHATRLRADISPFYMMDPKVCDRIARTIPNPLLMVNMRSPYARVLSWYQKYRQEEHPIGWLAADPKVHAEALEIGLTAATLEHYIERFGRERVLLVDYADLKRDPVELARRLQRRLGLDVETPPSVTREVNASVHYRSQHLRRLAHLAGPMVRKLSPELFYAVKFGPLHDIVFAKRRIAGPSLDQKLAALGSLREALEADIGRLEEMTGQDLTGWRYEAQVAALAPEPARSPVPASRPGIETSPNPRPASPNPAPTPSRGWAAARRRLGLEARALWSLAKDPEVPLRARTAPLVVASYLIMPFDIIPDRIPVVGHLDEAMAIPLAVALFFWLLPAKLVDRYRRTRAAGRLGSRPRTGAA
ncbi:hypothetical protein GCM10011611_04950 [Aliidongia dinghuensis]|uniref:DUF1232 domain-containing protein n=1 Tax=Aliidongia dinghuensis TaxID=1867774 RepID=A0A8J3E0J3_9PROT|nr:sulfotransferase [Aliidongia dinghuensis]GGF02451.1 hypothetical protein GCM10011611_04950 [Aliidongia dinghuensis]